MPTITGEITIDRPVEEVFDFVADERNEPLYNQAMLRSEKITDGPVALGTRFRAMHKSFPRPAAMAVEIIGYERPHRLESRTTMSWSEVVGELSFEPAGDKTEMRWAWDVRLEGLSRLLKPLIGAVGRRQERACWEGLKRHLENPPADEG